MREAIYESHGIMASADKNPKAGYFKKERKFHKFGVKGTRHHSVNEKSQADTMNDDELIDQAPVPLTARVTPSSQQ